MYRGKVRSARSYDPAVWSLASAVLADSDVNPSKAIQSEKDSSDINFIVERFGITQMVPIGPKLPEYGDFDEINDYQSALNAVRVAGEEFMQLPAKLRSRFDNDPQKLLEFLDNPENKDEAVKLGLTKPVPIVDNAPSNSDKDTNDGRVNGSVDGGAKAPREVGDGDHGKGGRVETP